MPSPEFMSTATERFSRNAESVRERRVMLAARLISARERVRVGLADHTQREAQATMAINRALRAQAVLVIARDAAEVLEREWKAEVGTSTVIPYPENQQNRLALGDA